MEPLSVCTLSLTDNLKAILRPPIGTAPRLKIVLLLDEADFILQVEDRLQHVMRAAFQSREVGDDRRAVVAGTTDCPPISRSGVPRLFNHFRFVPLKPLSERTSCLITEPADRCTIPTNPPAIQRFLR